MRKGIAFDRHIDLKARIYQYVMANGAGIPE